MPKNPWPLNAENEMALLCRKMTAQPAVVGAGAPGPGRAGALMHPGAVIGQVYLCCVPVDFRKQIDGLAALVQGELQLDVFGDALFVFVNRQRSRIKILYWHRNGFCLWQKRLEKERFAWPSPGSHTTVTLSPKSWSGCWKALISGPI